MLTQILAKKELVGKGVATSVSSREDLYHRIWSSLKRYQPKRRSWRFKKRYMRAFVLDISLAREIMIRKMLLIGFML